MRPNIAVGNCKTNKMKAFHQTKNAIKTTNLELLGFFFLSPDFSYEPLKINQNISLPHISLPRLPIDAVFFFFYFSLSLSFTFYIFHFSIFRFFYFSLYLSLILYVKWSLLFVCQIFSLVKIWPWHWSTCKWKAQWNGAKVTQSVYHSRMPEHYLFAVAFWWHLFFCKELQTKEAINFIVTLCLLLQSVFLLQLVVCLSHSGLPWGRITNISVEAAK